MEIEIEIEIARKKGVQMAKHCEVKFCCFLNYYFLYWSGYDTPWLMAQMMAWSDYVRIFLQRGTRGTGVSVPAPSEGSQILLFNLNYNLKKYAVRKHVEVQMHDRLRMSFAHVDVT